MNDLRLRITKKKSLFFALRKWVNREKDKRRIGAAYVALTF